MEDTITSLEKAKQRDYFHLQFPEIEEVKLDNILRKNAALDIPDIPDAADAGMQDISEQPKEKKMSKKEMEEALEDLMGTVDNLDVSRKIMEAKQDILDEVAQELKLYRKELDEFLHKKTPQRKFFDSGGAYKENLYSMVTSLLDEVMPYLFEALPDYSLIATQISKTYEDGTVENGIVAVKISIDYETYKYDFKVDVPILNGIIQSPLYIQRGLKILPLTKDAIDTELSSISFRKSDPDKHVDKPNLFNNIGENTLRKHDNQKFYETESQLPAAVGLPPRSTWDPSRGRG